MVSELKIDEYFNQELPRQFAAAMAGAPRKILDQEDLSITYELLGDGGCAYGLRVSGDTMDVVPGGIATSDMRTILSVADWAQTHAVAWEEPLIRFVRQGKVHGVKGLRGAFKLELKRENMPNFHATTIFGGCAEPEVTLRMKVADYVALTKGALNGQMAFMVGKIKFEGSLPLLLQIALNT